MSRRARMIGLAGAVALATGLALAPPAHAATTPDGELTMPVPGEEELCDGAGQHQWIFQLTIDRGTGEDANDAIVDITAFTVTETDGGTPRNVLSDIQAGDNPLQPGESVAFANVIGPSTGGQLSASITFQARSAGDEDPAGEPVTVDFGPEPYAACGPTSPTVPTSSSTTSSTTSSTSSSTTSTTSGSTTSSTDGSTTSTSDGATTTSTSTTLGPNDTTGALTISPTTVAPGGTISVTGTGFAANTDVTLTLFSDPVSLGTLRSNASGAIAGSVAIPASVPAGAHKVEAKGTNAAGNGINLLRGDLTVRAASGTIARTGGASDYLLPFGIAVVSFGILALAWRERRLTV